MKIPQIWFSATLWTLALGATAYAQPDTGPKTLIQPQRPPRRARPVEPALQIEQDLREFAALINDDHLFPEGQLLIYGARPGYYGAEVWLREEGGLITAFPMVIGKIAIDKIAGDSASATISYSFVLPDYLRNQVDANTPAELKKQLAALKQERRETVSLQRNPIPMRDGERTWQIVPPDAHPPDLDATQLDGIWATLSYFLAQKQPLDVADRAKWSQRNLKQLGLGMQMFTLDYDDLFAFTPASFPDALQPYLKTKDLIFVPGQAEIYRFNLNLIGKSTGQIAAPAQTVMLYEGEDEKPTFRYDGKAAILFADGHVALLSPDEAKNLIWKP